MSNAWSSTNIRVASVSVDDFRAKHSLRAGFARLSGLLRKNALVMTKPLHAVRVSRVGPDRPDIAAIRIGAAKIAWSMTIVVDGGDVAPAELRSSDSGIGLCGL